MGEEYFFLISSYTCLTPVTCCQALQRQNCFARMMRFLLGERATKSMFAAADLSSQKQHVDAEKGSGDATAAAAAMQDNNNGDDDDVPHRWTSTSAPYFHMLHSCIGNFILATDLSSLCQTDEPMLSDDEVLPLSPSLSHASDENNADELSSSTTTTKAARDVPPKLPLSNSMRIAVQGVVAKRYFTELLSYLRENTDHKLMMPLTRKITLYCSINNYRFSRFIIDLIMNQLQ